MHLILLYSSGIFQLRAYTVFMQGFRFQRLSIHYGDTKRTEVEHVFLNHGTRLHSMKTTDDINHYISALGQGGWQIVAASFDFERSIEYIVFQRADVSPV